MVETNPLLKNVHEREEKLSSTRPKCFEDFIGQNDIKRNLSVFSKSAKQRDSAMDHVLFYGPPGLGKTTLAQIIAHEFCQSLRYMLIYLLSLGIILFFYLLKNIE